MVTRVKCLWHWPQILATPSCRWRLIIAMSKNVHKVALWLLFKRHFLTFHFSRFYQLKEANSLPESWKCFLWQLSTVSLAARSLNIFFPKHYFWLKTQTIMHKKFARLSYIFSQTFLLTKNFKKFARSLDIIFPKISSESKLKSILHKKFEK